MKHFATAMLVLGIMLAVPPIVRAADITCPPNPTPGSTVNGNLVVPPGGFCILNGVTVTGNVQTNGSVTFAGEAGADTINGNFYVGTGASVDMESFNGVLATIGGNILANGCFDVELVNSPIVVGGNFRIQNCESGGYFIAEIAGNFDCSNTSVCLAESGKVHGNVLINNNSNAAVTNNTIGGNLQCAGNGSITDLSNNTALPNRVGGHKQGQCAGF